MTDTNKKLDEQEFMEKYNLSWDFESWSLKKLVLVHKRYEVEVDVFDDFHFDLQCEIFRRLRHLAEKKS